MANINISLKEDVAKKALGDDEVAMRRFRCLKECSNRGYSQSKIKHKKDFEKLARELGETVEFLYDAVDRYKFSFILDALRGDVKKKGDKSDKVKKEGKKNKSSSVIKKKKEEIAEISREAVKHRKKGGDVKKNNNLLNEMLNSIKEQEYSLTMISNNQERFDKKYRDVPKLGEKFALLERNMGQQLGSVRKKMEFLERIPNLIKYDELRAEYAALNRRIKKLEDAMSRLLEPIPDLKSGIKAIDNNFFEHIIDKNVSEKLDSIGRSFETLEGRLGLLNEIYENGKANSETGSQALEHDEGSLVQLSEYCQKALDVLTIAARHYARNQECISETESMPAMQSEDIRKEPVEERHIIGENKVLKDLIEKFADLDTLFNSDISNDKILAHFLMNKGLHRNEELSRGKEIEINPSNRESFELKAEFRNEGTYIVKQSCFEFNDDIIRRAKLEMKE